MENIWSINYGLLEVSSNGGTQTVDVFFCSFFWTSLEKHQMLDHHSKFSRSNAPTVGSKSWICDGKLRWKLHISFEKGIEKHTSKNLATNSHEEKIHLVASFKISVCVFLALLRLSLHVMRLLKSPHIGPWASCGSSRRPSLLALGVAYPWCTWVELRVYLLKGNTKCM